MNGVRFQIQVNILKIQKLSEEKAIHKLPKTSKKQGKERKI